MRTRPVSTPSTEQQQKNGHCPIPAASESSALRLVFTFYKTRRKLGAEFIEADEGLREWED